MAFLAINSDLGNAQLLILVIGYKTTLDKWSPQKRSQLLLWSGKDGQATVFLHKKDAGHTFEQRWPVWPLKFSVGYLTCWATSNLAKDPSNIQNKKEYKWDIWNGAVNTATEVPAPLDAPTNTISFQQYSPITF
jgi:hypothetical protein